MLCLDECNNCLLKKKKSKEKVAYLNRIFFFFSPALFNYNHFLTVFIFKYFGEIEYLGLKVNEKKEKKKLICYLRIEFPASKSVW